MGWQRSNQDTGSTYKTPDPRGTCGIGSGPPERVTAPHRLTGRAGETGYHNRQRLRNPGAWSHPEHDDLSGRE